jgi:hypothetical protein
MYGKIDNGWPMTESCRGCSILCECRKVYVAQIGWSVETRGKEHTRHMRLYHPNKSAVVEHWIKFSGTKILAKTAGYMDRLVSEAIEVWLHSNNISREEEFKLSQAFNPAFSILQANNTDNFNNTKWGRFWGGQERQWQTEDHAPG